MTVVTASLAAAIVTACVFFGWRWARRSRRQGEAIPVSVGYMCEVVDHEARRIEAHHVASCGDRPPRGCSRPDGQRLFHWKRDIAWVNRGVRCEERPRTDGRGSEVSRG